MEEIADQVDAMCHTPAIGTCAVTPDDAYMHRPGSVEESGLRLCLMGTRLGD